MTASLRRAGRGIDASGSIVVWSVSEGSRGRRWREVRTRPDGAILSSLLLETDRSGRFAHTELSTAAGLLTLHPEADGSIHGNAITGAGVRHVIGVPWDPAGLVLVEGSPIAAAAATRLLDDLPAGSSASRLTLLVDLDLAVDARPRRVERSAADRWTFADGLSVAVGDDGVPSLASADEWPLEVE